MVPSEPLIALHVSPFHMLILLLTSKGQRLDKCGMRMPRAIERGQTGCQQSNLLESIPRLDYGKLVLRWTRTSVHFVWSIRCSIASIQYAKGIVREQFGGHADAETRDDGICRIQNVQLVAIQQFTNGGVDEQVLLVAVQERVQRVIRNVVEQTQVGQYGHSRQRVHELGHQWTKRCIGNVHHSYVIVQRSNSLVRIEVKISFLREVDQCVIFIEIVYITEILLPEKEERKQAKGLVTMNVDRLKWPQHSMRAQGNCVHRKTNGYLSTITMDTITSYEHVN